VTFRNRTVAVVAEVGLEAQFDVGLDRIETLVLERVSLGLVAEPDASPLLAEVQDDPASFPYDELGGTLEPLAAVAT
jgi:hypothetical protein